MAPQRDKYEGNLIWVAQKLFSTSDPENGKSLDISFETGLSVRENYRTFTLPRVAFIIRDTVGSNYGKVQLELYVQELSILNKKIKNISSKIENNIDQVFSSNSTISIEKALTNKVKSIRFTFSEKSGDRMVSVDVKDSGSQLGAGKIWMPYITFISMRDILRQIESSYVTMAFTAANSSVIMGLSDGVDNLIKSSEEKLSRLCNKIEAMTESGRTNQSYEEPDIDYLETMAPILASDSLNHNYFEKKKKTGINVSPNMFKFSSNVLNGKLETFHLLVNAVAQANHTTKNPDLFSPSVHISTQSAVFWNEDILDKILIGDCHANLFFRNGIGEYLRTGKFPEYNGNMIGLYHPITKDSPDTWYFIVELATYSLIYSLFNSHCSKIGFGDDRLKEKSDYGRFVLYPNMFIKYFFSKFFYNIDSEREEFVDGVLMTFSELSNKGTFDYIKNYYSDWSKGGTVPADHASMHKYASAFYKKYVTNKKDERNIFSVSDEFSRLLDIKTPEDCRNIFVEIKYGKRDKDKTPLQKRVGLFLDCCGNSINDEVRNIINDGVTSGFADVKVILDTIDDLDFHAVKVYNTIKRNPILETKEEVLRKMTEDEKNSNKENKYEAEKNKMFEGIPDLDELLEGGDSDNEYMKLFGISKEELENGDSESPTSTLI